MQAARVRDVRGADLLVVGQTKPRPSPRRPSGASSIPSSPRPSVSPRPPPPPQARHARSLAAAAVAHQLKVTCLLAVVCRRVCPDRRAQGNRGDAASVCGEERRVSGWRCEGRREGRKAGRDPDRTSRQPAETRLVALLYISPTTDGHGASAPGYLDVETPAHPFRLHRRAPPPFPFSSPLSLLSTRPTTTETKRSCLHCNSCPPPSTSRPSCRTPSSPPQTPTRSAP